MSTAITTNGHQNGHASDEQIDTLYAFWPGIQPAPAPCPEAAFSLTLKGKLDGIETLLTVRGMTAEAFHRNLQQVRGLLDAPAPSPAVQPASPGQEWCSTHQCAMHRNEKQGRVWYSHRTADGFCKGK
jgi:hypothetical protein